MSVWNTEVTRRLDAERYDDTSQSDDWDPDDLSDADRGEWDRLQDLADELSGGDM